MADTGDSNIIRDLFGEPADSDVISADGAESPVVSPDEDLPLDDQAISVLEDIYAMHARGQSLTAIASRWQMLPSEVRDIIMDGKSRGLIPTIYDPLLTHREANRILFEEVNAVEQSLELTRGDKALLKMKLLDGVERHTTRQAQLLQAASPQTHRSGVGGVGPVGDSGDGAGNGAHVVISIEGGTPVTLRRGNIIPIADNTPAPDIAVVESEGGGD